MRQPGRRFGLLDAIIAVAAIALVASLLRYRAEWDRRINDNPFPAPRDGWSATGVVIRAPVALELCETPLAILTAAWLVILLRKPAPIADGASRGPGSLACLTAALALGAGILLTWAGTAAKALATRGFSAKAWEDPFLREPWAVINSGVHATAAAAGFAVAAAWIALRRRDRPRSDRDWFDLAGRALGAAWLIMALNQMTLIGIANELIRIGR